MSAPPRLPRDEQPICHFCIRPEEDVDVLFETDEDPEYGPGPNICDACVRSAYAALERMGAKALAAKRRRRLSVVTARD